jgi:sulfate adenylyltransferase
MISPHGGSLVDRVISRPRSEQLSQRVSDGPTIRLDRSQYQDVVNVATGRYSPLEGFMGEREVHKVVHDMALEDGTTWPIPITLDVAPETADAIAKKPKAGLRAPSGDLIGAIDVEGIHEFDPAAAVGQLFCTDDAGHPGVASFLDQEQFIVAGDVELFETPRYSEFDLLPIESRMLFDAKDWDTVAGFQTRNAPHRAHEYIQKTALELTDGLFIHPKIGQKKRGDYTDSTIMKSYQTLIDRYFPEETVALSIYPNRMHYAGPREALLDAIVRKNQGCTHFIIGRDHAGVGDYYGEFEAQEVFESCDVGIEGIYFDYSRYCHECDGMVSRKVCPHGGQLVIEPNGTEIRSLISEGESPPTKMMRPEVAEQILGMDDPFVGTPTGGT